MSVALFDLGQRLRAATLGQPVARSSFAPVLPPVDPVAVMVNGSGAGVLVRAADASRQTAAGGADALRALTELGVAGTSEQRTLVVADRDTLDHLLDLAQHTDPASEAAGAAPVVGWWTMRADHPGTGAVLNVTAACAARWVLGVPPAAERLLRTWRAGLNIGDRGAGGLLKLAELVSAGTTLPGLDAFAEDDRDSWQSFVARLQDPKSTWDWRKRDNRREAALGLATRCDAAELYESVRLGDPLVAVRESFAGTVVSGTITVLPSKSMMEVALDQLTCRLRENTAVEGFYGYPRDLPPAGTTSPVVHGRVLTTRVSSAERLVITIGDAVIRGARAGQRLTLRPRSVDPNQQRSGRHELHRRYAVRRSWLSGGAPPVPRRRDVPLDVVVAAAE